MGEPSQLRPEKLQNRPMVPQFYVWATQYFSRLFVQQKMPFRVQILCLYKWITANNIVLRVVSLEVLRNVKVKQATVKSSHRVS